MDKNKTDEYALKEFIKALPDLLRHKKHEIIIQKSRSLAENTNSSIAYNILGNSLFQIGKVEESITYLEKSLELRQDFFPVYKNLDHKDPVLIAKEGVSFAKQNGNNLVIIDTAGRLAVDEKMILSSFISAIFKHILFNPIFILKRVLFKVSRIEIGLFN